MPKKSSVRKREKALQELALRTKVKHDRDMKGVRTVLIPHPTQARTWIERIVK